MTMSIERLVVEYETEKLSPEQKRLITALKKANRDRMGGVVGLARSFATTEHEGVKDLKIE